VQEYTIESRKIMFMLGIYPKNIVVLLKCLGGLCSHLHKQAILFKPRIFYEACVQSKYLENIGYKKGKQSGSR
jgi:hypothetical protein